MDDIKYIKRMHDCEGTSIREIMRRTGYHFETVKKYLDQNDFNELHYPTREIPSLLDPLKPIIEEWLTEDLKAPRKQRHTAKRIYARLQKEYPNLLEVKLRTVQYYVSQKRTKIYAFLQDAYLPLYHAPGGSQVDFCHFAYYDNSQVMQDGLKLTMSFPYSNAAYCQIFRSENQETHYGIEPFFCNGAAGWEKGNVENKVGYERRNMFVPVPTILDFDEFNKRLFELSGEDCDREHYVKRERMDVLFKEDRNAMYPLNPVAFEVCSFESRIADKYGKISYENNRYSSSPTFAQKSVYVKATSNMVYLLDSEYKLIMDHPRLYGNGQESMKWLPYIELMSRRPTAIKYTSIYEELPDNRERHLNSLSSNDKGKSLMVLHTMLKNHEMNIATDVLSITWKFRPA